VKLGSARERPREKNDPEKARIPKKCGRACRRTVRGGVKNRSFFPEGGREGRLGGKYIRHGEGKQFEDPLISARKLPAGN